MNRNYKKGIAVFIAVITVSALLLIALAISDISYKEQLISFSGRESRVAFFAADSGVECALFHDLKGGADGLFKFAVPGGEALGVINCNGGEILSVIGGSSVVVTTFYFNVPDSPKSCAIVRVSKTDAGAGDIDTKIESRGYNNNCEGPPSNPAVSEGPRNLERSFEVTY